MSAPFPRNLLRVPAELVWNPSDIMTAFPHGGTQLGLVRDIDVKLNARYTDVVAEEFAAHVIDNVYEGEGIIVSAVVRDGDPDAFAKVFPNTSTSTITKSTRFKGYAVDAAYRPGLLGSTMAGKLVVSPRAVDDHPMLILYNAIPILNPEALIQYCWSKEMGILVSFVGTPNSSGKIWEFDKRRNLTAP
jgi:hypothetical protein